MHSILASSLLLSTFLTNALSLPTVSKPQKSRFIATLQKSKLGRRYNGEAETDVVVSKVGTQGINWVTTVDIGGYTGNLFIDTGSADLWVLGDQAPNPNGQPVYYPVSSNADPGETFDIQYVGENNWVKGDVAIDDVTVAGLTIPSMKLGVANAVGSDNVGQEFDGLIGLSFGSQNTISPSPSLTFMELALPYLDQPVFAVNLKGDGSGTIEFGTVDDAGYSGDLMGVSVDNSSSAWHVNGVTFDVGDQSFSQQMLFDTGAISTTVDPSVAAAYWGQVDGAEDTAGDGSGWEYPCGATLPDFNLYMDGQVVTLAGGLLAWADAGQGDGMCQAGLQGGSDSGTMGDAFFESYYVVFNQADPSIQFAPQA